MNVKQNENSHSVGSGNIRSCFWSCFNAMWTVHCRSSTLLPFGRSTHRRHVKPAVPSQAWKRYIFQRTVACANIGVESSLAWRPSPLHRWREAPHLKHVLRVNIRQDKLPRKQLEGGINGLDWMERRISEF